jgi:hypothetical protein
MPNWLQTVLLTILLLIVVRKTLAKGLKMWQSEKKDVQLKRKLEQDARYCEEDSESDTEGVLHEEAYHMKPHRYQITGLPHQIPQVPNQHHEAPQVPN